MSTPIPLPLDRPLAALCEASGVTVYALSRLRGTAPATSRDAADRGGGISVETLASWLKAAGYELVLTAKKIDTVIR